MKNWWKIDFEKTHTQTQHSFPLQNGSFNERKMGERKKNWKPQKYRDWFSDWKQCKKPKKKMKQKKRNKQITKHNLKIFTSGAFSSFWSVILRNERCYLLIYGFMNFTPSKCDFNFLLTSEFLSCFFFKARVRKRIDFFSLRRYAPLQVNSFHTRKNDRR